MRNFRKLNIWNNGIALAITAYRLTASFPKEEMFGLKNQIRRAAVSIPSNIAEGCSRGTDKDYGRFLEISLGSFEVETDMIIAQQLNYLPDSTLLAFLEDLHREQRQINALLSRLVR